MFIRYRGMVKKLDGLRVIILMFGFLTTCANIAHGQGNNTTRYIASSVIPVESHEIKIFNNLYTQKTNSRSTFYTTLINYLYGISPMINIGIDARYRAVALGPSSSSVLDVFGTNDSNVMTRNGLTAIGPKVRWAPISKWDNFSIQSSFLIPLGRELKGNGQQLYIDWDGPTWNFQCVNDFTLGYAFSLYAEIGFIWEDIGQKSNGRVNQSSIPITSILSYFVTSDWTIYGLGNYAPFLQSETDYYYQYGLGTKYRFKNNIEVEVLLTDFNRKILNDADGTASTYNLGVRYSIW